MVFFDLQQLELIKILFKNFSGILKETKVFVRADKFTISISSPFPISSFFLILKNHTFFQLKQIYDLFGMDLLFSNTKFRFCIVYGFISHCFNFRVEVEYFFRYGESIPSSVFLYPASNWLERECWDLFGFVFSSHPDLRRLLTDYGFEGHPLRKDFPLSGFSEVRYNELLKQIVVEPVELTQNYRYFDFSTPWKE